MTSSEINIQLLIAFVISGFLWMIAHFFVGKDKARTQEPLSIWSNLYWIAAGIATISFFIVFIIFLNRDFVSKKVEGMFALLIFSWIIAFWSAYNYGLHKNEIKPSSFRWSFIFLQTGIIGILGFTLALILFL